jgi:hypothetical protein
VLSCLSEKKRTGPGSVMMPAIRFIDGVSDVPTDSRFLIVPDAQITLSDFRPVRETDMKVICRKPVLFRLRIAGMIQPETDRLISQVIHRIKHLPASVFSASFRFPGLYPSQAGCSSPVHPL